LVMLCFNMISSTPHIGAFSCVSLDKIRKNSQQNLHCEISIRNASCIIHFWKKYILVNYYMQKQGEKMVSHIVLLSHQPTSTANPALMGHSRPKYVFSREIKLKRPAKLIFHSVNPPTKYICVKLKIRKRSKQITIMIITFVIFMEVFCSKIHIDKLNFYENASL